MVINKNLFREEVLVQFEVLLPLYSCMSFTVERHVNYVNRACVCADMCTWQLSRTSLTYVTIEQLHVSSLETVRHFATYNYQSFARFRKVKEEAVICNSVDHC